MRAQEDQSNTVWRDALISGSTASIISAVVVAAFSRAEEGSAAGAINAPSQWIWGEHAGYVRGPSVKHTVVGYVVHHASSILWALGYEQLLRREAGIRNPTSTCANAAAIAAAAYVVDHTVVPHRLRPGFTKHVGPTAIAATYAAVAAGFALARLLVDRK